MSDGSRRLALITGASRRAGIGAAIARRLARDGWDVATTFWRADDEVMPSKHPDAAVQCETLDQVADVADGM